MDSQLFRLHLDLFVSHLAQTHRVATTLLSTLVIRCTSSSFQVGMVAAMFFNFLRRRQTLSHRNSMHILLLSLLSADQTILTWISVADHTTGFLQLWTPWPIWKPSTLCAMAVLWPCHIKRIDVHSATNFLQFHFLKCMVICKTALKLVCSIHAVGLASGLGRGHQSISDAQKLYHSMHHMIKLACGLKNIGIHLYFVYIVMYVGYPKKVWMPEKSPKDSRKPKEPACIDSIL